jgi:SAM-dependent methyltransferase
VNDDDVRGFWEGNAETWTRLARAGYDVYRDSVNTPGFLRILPDVGGLRGLDLGCGEGHNTRLVARRGARMTAVDISETFLRHAKEEESREPLGIAYRHASALALPFEDRTFDFVVAFMSIMDVPDPERALREAFRVLAPSGFLQFSITHPCFQTPRWQWIRDAAGKKIAVACGDYFRRLDGDIEEWTFGAAPESERAGAAPFRIPRFTRTLSEWMNTLLDLGFVLDRFEEPRADEETVARVPRVADTRIIAYSLIVRARRPP